MKIKAGPALRSYDGRPSWQRASQLVRAATAKGVSKDRLVEQLAREFLASVRNLGEGLGMWNREDLIQGKVRDTASGLIKLSQDIQPGEREIFLEILMMAARIHHTPTFQHQERVAALSLRVAAELGLASEEEDSLSIASLLHDIGKVIVPVRLLDAKRRLNHNETFLVKNMHLLFGYYLLDSIPFLKNAARIVGFNHVFDGYQPEGFSENAIPLAGQILSAADFYDALTDLKRAYKPPFPPQEALRYVSARPYDPTLLAALKKILAAGTAGT